MGSGHSEDDLGGLIALPPKSSEPHSEMDGGFWGVTSPACLTSSDTDLARQTTCKQER